MGKAVFETTQKLGWRIDFGARTVSGTLRKQTFERTTSHYLNKPFEVHNDSIC